LAGREITRYGVFIEPENLSPYTISELFAGYTNLQNLA
jgi:hypothetical protein